MDDVVRPEDQLPVPSHDASGRWAPGNQSGSRRGRPMRGYSSAEQWRQKFFDEMPAQFEVLKAAARGERAISAPQAQAMKLFWDRALGTMRSVEAPTAPLQFDGTTVGLLRALYNAMSQGHIGWEMFAKVLGALAPHLEAQLLELDKEGSTDAE